MNFLLIIFLLFISFFVLLFWLIGKGIENKFGYEWIPWELGLDFYHFDIVSENRKVIKFSLSSFDLEKFNRELNKFDERTGNNLNSDDLNSDPIPYKIWKKISNDEYNFINFNTGNTIAVLNLKEAELLYFKKVK